MRYWALLIILTLSASLMGCQSSRFRSHWTSVSSTETQQVFAPAPDLQDSVREVAPEYQAFEALPEPDVSPAPALVPTVLAFPAPARQLTSKPEKEACPGGT